MLTDIFANLALKKGTILHIAPGFRGHEITFSPPGGPTVEIVLDEQTVRDLFMTLIQYPLIGPCFDEALRRCHKKIKRAEARKAKAEKKP